MRINKGQRIRSYDLGRIKTRNNINNNYINRRHNKIFRLISSDSHSGNDICASGVLCDMVVLIVVSIHLHMYYIYYYYNLAPGKKPEIRPNENIVYSDKSV